MPKSQLSSAKLFQMQSALHVTNTTLNFYFFPEIQCYGSYASEVRRVVTKKMPFIRTV
jgi:hypothetical protein